MRGSLVAGSFEILNYYPISFFAFSTSLWPRILNILLPGVFGCKATYSHPTVFHSD